MGTNQQNIVAEIWPLVYGLKRLPECIVDIKQTRGRPPVYKMDRGLFSWSVGLTYEQSAVKLVVGVLKSGTVLCKTHAHIGLLNVTHVFLSFILQYLRYERQRVVKFEVSVFVLYH